MTDLHVLQRRLNLPTYSSAAVSQHVKKTPYCKNLVWPTFIPPFAQHHVEKRFLQSFPGREMYGMGDVETRTKHSTASIGLPSRTRRKIPIC